MNKYAEIGNRLREWAIARFGTVGEFAKALYVVSEGVSPYLSGKARPGNKMQEKLRALGCDITWLMTGETTAEIQRKFDLRTERLIEKGLTKEDYAMIAMLHGLGINDTKQLSVTLDWKSLKPKLYELEKGMISKLKKNSDFDKSKPTKTKKQRR